MMTTIETIYARRSIRQYQDKTVEKEKLEILLKAAMAAPSAMNIKPGNLLLSLIRKFCRRSVHH
jgi:nitroreductase